MEENYDKLLVKWIDGDLTSEEKESFEKSEHYQSYRSIIEGVSKLKVPEQQTADEAYADFQRKLKSSSSTKEAKVVKFPIWRYMGYAASIIFALAIGTYFMGQTTVETAVADHQNITLPDNSLVMVNAASELTYNKYLFNFTRKIDLEGEAFFEVQKGSDFTVSTANGSVSVLGTKFNVASKASFFETACFEGKVKVSAGGDNETLTQGQKLSFMEGNKKIEDFDIIDSSKPTWASGRSTFKSAPLQHVINQLEAQYPITIDSKAVENKLARSYTGLFPHDDIDEALENVFLPMGITYSKDKNDNSHIILKNQQ
ncbi:FecR family protein [Fulvivirga sediminis]|uniref:FecR domain-containing protein n=1 Tax=Fulvivirga sediminis TaxID=2803949 RepID=A0A937FAL6_9BACT|nr:FecR family protein [Fulvivirga sediminis]MBL3657674.1 FecR domain-containing protein [Fulvivirga sediminis]